jgi:hypothetical protein
MDQFTKNKMNSIPLKLELDIQPFQTKISHSNKIILIGSCFSDEMGSHFHKNGFDSLSNPFGTVFHPTPIARLIIETIDGIKTERIFSREDLYFSWDTSGTIFGFSSVELDEMIEKKRKLFLKFIKESSHLFITFGTSIGYQQQNSNIIVANCHKQSKNHFFKSMTDLDVLKEEWKTAMYKLKTVNPNLQIIFTVSPVRHTRDGLIENNRSKSRLFELISHLETKFKAFYFPSYEIMIDELRDYRFYDSDLIHPNKLATNYIWNRLAEKIFDQKTIFICEEIQAISNLKNHKIIHQNSIESIKFEKIRQQKINEFNIKYPKINLP